MFNKRLTSVNYLLADRIATRVEDKSAQKQSSSRKLNGNIRQNYRGDSARANFLNRKCQFSRSVSCISTVERGQDKIT